MGIPSDRRFLAVVGKRLVHLFPGSAQAVGVLRRRCRVADTLEWLMRIFASQSPGFTDDLLLIDSSPVECARSRETVMRSELADAPTTAGAARTPGTSGDSGCTRSSAPEGTPRALELCSPSSMSARAAWFCWTAASATRAIPFSATRDMPAAGSRRPSAIVTRHSPARTAKTSAEPAASRADPPTDRVDPLALHRPPHPRAPRRTNPRRAARTDPRSVLLPRRSDHSQPSTRTPQPCVNYCA